MHIACKDTCAKLFRREVSIIKYKQLNLFINNFLELRQLLLILEKSLIRIAKNTGNAYFEEV